MHILEWRCLCIGPLSHLVHAAYELPHCERVAAGRPGVGWEPRCPCAATPPEWAFDSLCTRWRSRGTRGITFTHRSLWSLLAPLGPIAALLRVAAVLSARLAPAPCCCRRSLDDPNGFWRDIAVNEFYWETEPDLEHVASNFDVRKVRR
jgi:hypothetical protein